MICLKIFICYLKSAPSDILSPNNFCFRCSLLVRDLDIYLFLRFNQIPAVVFSSMTSYMTSSALVIDRLNLPPSCRVHPTRHPSSFPISLPFHSKPLPSLAAPTDPAPFFATTRSYQFR